MTKRFRLRVEEEYPQALETKWNNLLQSDTFKDNKELWKLSQTLLQHILQNVDIVPNTHYKEIENIKEVNKPVDPQLEKRVEELTKKVVEASESVLNQRKRVPKLIQEQNEKMRVQSEDKPIESHTTINIESEEEKLQAMNREVQKTIREMANTLNEVHTPVKDLHDSLPETIKKAKRIKDALSIEIRDITDQHTS
eukprot:TRINITY_DN3732_c0_g1_i1.p1 TRINITY_DN3732_c0_g1~~TRINITY_DN3732_c0_g1_i1.p1  ORF type:complete len:196 (+),score=40.80 TRINITY_DN3732_c0_g1_i1:201-788(+)